MVPNNDQPGAYPGALSRVDNETEICSACGEDEALGMFFEGYLAPIEEWPVERKFSLPPVPPEAMEVLRNLQAQAEEGR
jgi:hypothetical protein